jgi:hypothetical protein
MGSGWGSHPTFRISGKLTFERCEREFVPNKYNENEWNISNQREDRSNYNVRRGTIDGKRYYALRMYRTDIITWHENGDIDLENFDSGITRDVLSHFGPLRVWKAPRQWPHNPTRWGRQYWWGEGPVVDYPFCPKYDRMTLHADGYVCGLFDERSRIKPELRPERRRLLKNYRASALPRILLGEFGDVFCVKGTHRLSFGRSHTGWWSRLPSTYVQRDLFELFGVSAGHEQIVEKIKSSVNWHPTNMADSRDEALIKAVNQMGRNALDYHTQYETVRTDYGLVNWRELER